MVYYIHEASRVVLRLLNKGKQDKGKKETKKAPLKSAKEKSQEKQWLFCVSSWSIYAIIAYPFKSK